MVISVLTGKNGIRGPRHARTAVSVLAIVVLAGCAEKRELAPFTGKVVYNGSALEFGAVMFQPISGGQPATGLIQPDGTFTMKVRGGGEGAPLGENRVRITCFPGQQQTVASSEQELALGASLIPTRYNSFGSSGLTVVVEAEQDEPYVFNLSDS